MNNDKNRTKTRIAAYLIGLKDNKILLGKRINTDHLNEHWSLPAGHVFEGESAKNAMIREAYEECGIHLQPNDLKAVGAFHHFSDPYDYANYIFKADLSNHSIINTEPEKCAQLEFFDLKQLPSPIAPYIQYVIEKSALTTEPWIDEINFL
ncbi:MAG: NUDIX domain-containing protein [Candidatus Babeliales bacterium]